MRERKTGKEDGIDDDIVNETHGEILPNCLIWRADKNTCTPLSKNNNSPHLMTFRPNTVVSNSLQFEIFLNVQCWAGKGGSVGSRGSRRLTSRGSVGFALAPLDEMESMRVEVVSFLIRFACKVSLSRYMRVSTSSRVFFLFLQSTEKASFCSAGFTRPGL